jgi:NADH-quinone oxidoreductase subunit K
MIIDLSSFLIVATLLFIIGIWGIILNRKNILIILISLELILLAVNANFIIFSVFLDDLAGQITTLYVLTVAAAEAAIGLAILVIFYRVRGTIYVEKLHSLKG